MKSSRDPAPATLKAALVALILCLLSRPALALPGEEGRPLLRNIAPRELASEDGEFGHQVFAFCQSPRGLLYIGNNQGVLEYDGVRWRTIPLPNDSDALSLDVDANGRIYAGGSGVFGYLAPDRTGRLAFVDLSRRLAAADRNFGDVWQTSVTPEGIVFRTPFYAFRFAEPVASGRIDAWKASAPLAGHVFHVGGAVGGKVYIREHRTGLLAIRGRELRLIPGTESLAEEQVFVYLPFDRGRVLLGTRTRGLLILDPGASRPEAVLTPFPTEADAFLREAQIYNGAVLPDGSFVFGTIRGGAIVVDRAGRLLRHFDQRHGLRGDMILSVFVDRQRNLWLGLNNGLATIQYPSALSRFGEEMGLKGDLRAVRRFRGVLYAATGLGLFSLVPASAHGDSEARFEPVQGVNIDTFALAEVAGTLLAGTDDGLYEVEGDRARFLFRSNVRAVAPSLADPSRVYAATVQGIVTLRREGSGWSAPQVLPGIGEEITGIAQTGPEDLWLGALYHGVFHVRVDVTPDTVVVRRVEHFGEADGLPAGLATPHRIGRRLVFSTRQRGYLFDAWRRHFVPDPDFAAVLPPGRPVGSLIEESNSSVWAVSLHRVLRLMLGPHGPYVAVPTPLSRIPEGDRAHDVYREEDGVLWVLTDAGLVRYDPVRTAIRPDTFQVLLRRVTAARAGIVVHGDETRPAIRPLPADANALRFQFAATSLVAPEKTQYQVRLDGLDRDWSAWSLETYKDYTSLPPGAYTFRVRARDVDGVGAEAAPLSFRVLPPWWRTWWAGLLWAAGAVLLGFGIVRLRVQHLERRNRELEALVAEKTRELREASLTDPLTGLRNRRSFAQVMQEESAAAVRQSREEPGTRLVLLLVDLDHFKSINDRHGHVAGDEVLRQAADRLRTACRASDILFRWGGEEFLLLARDTGRAGGTELAARVLEAFRAAPATLRDGQLQPLTGSVGWAPYPWFPDAPDALTPEDVLRLADRCLYLAKAAGRDRALGAEPATTAAEVRERWPDWQDRPLETGEGTWVRLHRLPPGTSAAVA